MAEKSVFDYAVEGTLELLEKVLLPDATKVAPHITRDLKREAIIHTIKIIKGMQVERSYQLARMKTIMVLVDRQAELPELWFGKTVDTIDLVRTHLRLLHAAIELKDTDDKTRH